MCVLRYMCNCLHMEVRGQLSGLNSVNWLVGKCPDLLKPPCSPLSLLNSELQSHYVRQASFVFITGSAF